MKANTVILFILLASSNFMFSQTAQDSLSVNYIYAPNNFSNSFSAEESWEIHKAAYIKQLKSKGFTDDEVKKSMVTYEKDKEEFIARVKEQHRLAEIQRKKATKQRALAEIERKKASKQRELAATQRNKAAEQRVLADAQRKKAAEQRAKHAIKRAKDSEQRAKQAIQRAKDSEQRAKQAIQRAKDSEQRMKDAIKRQKAQEWRKNAKNILTKNITLTNLSNNNKPITFKITSKKTLRVGIRAHINSGITSIEIYNPNGIKKGELSLNFKSKTDLNEERETLKHTSGALDKTILTPEIGEWQIKISSQKSEGTIAISVAQYTKPTMND